MFLTWFMRRSIGFPEIFPGSFLPLQLQELAMSEGGSQKKQVPTTFIILRYRKMEYVAWPPLMI